MATVDESNVDEPVPKAFCRRISVAEYEALAASETEKQLNSLLDHLQQNPAIFAEFLKQRHDKEMEDGGLFATLKKKFLSMFFGDSYESMDQETRDKKWKEFEATTINTYNVSQQSKGNAQQFSRRTSRRIAERQQRKLQAQQKSCAPCPPPPPPLPWVVQQQTSGEDVILPKKVKRQIKKSLQLSSSSSDDKKSPNHNLGEEIRTMSKKYVKRRPLREVQQNKDDFLSNLLSMRSKLRKISPPDETPYHLSKIRRKNNKENENNFPLFNQELIKKFQNTRSPQSPQSNSACDSPYSPE